jgi:hypothetical protein
MNMSKRVNVFELAVQEGVNDLKVKDTRESEINKGMSKCFNFR